MSRSFSMLLGGTSLVVASVLSSPIKAQDARLFLTDDGAGTDIASVDQEGLNLFQVIPDEPDIVVQFDGLGLDYDRCHVYYPTGRGIDRVNFNGTDRVNVFQNDVHITFPVAVRLDLENGHMYWTSPSSGGRIARANLDGSNPEDLVLAGDADPQVDPGSLFLDVPNDVMYWYDAGICGIRSASLDGSNVQDRYTSANMSDGSAFDRMGQKIYFVQGDNFCSLDLSDDSVAVVFSFPGGINDDSLAVDHETDRLYFAQGNVLYWTSLSNPGAEISSNEIPELSTIRSIDIMPGPQMRMTMNPPVASWGENVELRLCGTQANSPYLVSVAELDGFPINLRLWIGVTDDLGEAALPFVVPEGLDASMIKLLGFAISPHSCLEPTTQATLSIEF